MVTLRDYQLKICTRAKLILEQYGIVYLALEMRLGKTLISLEVCKRLQARSVLFITKKKAIQSILNDYRLGAFSFNITVINYEQLDKVKGKFDFIIIDEAHGLGAFPKPALRTKRLKNLVGTTPVIFLSGTPTPESYSQIFHQLWISDYSPFNNFKNFYAWAEFYVDIKSMFFRSVRVKDYSNARHLMIKEQINHLFISYTQAEAGFTTESSEKVDYIYMLPATLGYILNLIKKRHVNINGHNIVADTPIKLLSKVHQLASGTVITESEEVLFLDNSKVQYIHRVYGHLRTVIFYKYTAEGTMIRNLLQSNTDNPEDFNAHKAQHFVCQIRAGALGINLTSADIIIFYNIDFSYLLYSQGKARTQDLHRTKENKVIWLFSNTAIEEDIYKTVLAKQDYTASYFQSFIKVKYERTNIAEKSAKPVERDGWICV